MERTLGFFPLNIVVFPEEATNLHIFEDRYKELIQDCWQQEEYFVIPPFLDNQVAEYGTVMRVKEISQTYEDGRMDIKTRGIDVCQVLTLENPLSGKLYAGGRVRFLEREEGFTPIKPELEKLSERFFHLIGSEPHHPLNHVEPVSYQLGHHAGLRIEQEYELLLMDDENERQEYLIQHLKYIMPMVEQVKNAKERIQQNGHFKELRPPHF